MLSLPRLNPQTFFHRHELLCNNPWLLDREEISEYFTKLVVESMGHPDFLIVEFATSRRNGEAHVCDRRAEEQTVCMAGATAVTLDEDGHPQGFDEINSTFWIQNDEYFGKNFQPEEGQIHVLVVLPELHQGASLHEGGARFSMTDKEEYERMVIEDSYAKYLSAIAETVAYFYKFECEFETFPTIDDVFYALKDGGWEFRLEEGNPLTAVELPKFFTEDEWNELKEMNDVLHDGKVFTKSTGKPFIVLPHDLYDEDLVAALKKMAITTNIVSDATEFEVYDENEF